MAILSDVSPATDQMPGEPRGRRWLVRRQPQVRLRLWFELALLASCYFAYSTIRNAVPEHEVAAQAHARTIWAIEKSLGIAVEQSINHSINSITWLIVAMNYYYATLHFLVTFAVMVWLYRSQPGRFAVFRATLLITTGIALVVFYLYPLAPPRLMTGGHFEDTVVLHQTWGSFASPSVASASNQFAAMPSMHFGWSAWCGIAIALCARRTWVRVLGALYPLATLVVIVATGNHYWLDAVGGGLALAAGAGIAFVLYYRIPTWPRQSFPRRVQP
jgi:hypothetical protein